MDEKMNKSKRSLSDEKLSDDEAEEILQRASKLQQEVENIESNISRSDLEAGANEVGIKQKYIDQAIEELKIERKQKVERQKKASLYTPLSVLR